MKLNVCSFGQCGELAEIPDWILLVAIAGIIGFITLVVLIVRAIMRMGSHE